MSTSKVIGKEALTAYERWELPAVSGSSAVTDAPGDGDAQRLMTAKELEALQEQAYREGLEQGRAAGLERGRAEIEAAVKDLNTIMAGLCQPFEDLDDTVEQQLVQLAIIVARQLIRRELRTDPGQIIAVVREALSALPVASRNTQLYLHPEDAELVRGALSGGSNADLSWEIIEDPVLTRGGCRVRADNSFIDATVEKRLTGIVATLLGGERGDDATQA
jgi:flagellar assembly protein FliH